MGLFVKFFLAATIMGMIAVTLISQKSSPLPQIKDEWWGDDAVPQVEDESIRPFKIEIPDEVIVDLHQRLNMPVRTVAPLKGAGFTYGVNSQFLETVRKFWLESYSWKEQESYLNSFPHFKTSISGLDIHFMHIKPQNTTKKILPLLMMHGWPGSFVEFLKIIPVLTEESMQENFVFEIIVPSLPGYGFSDAARKPGLGAIEMSLIFDKLMKRLQFNSYYVQGGDWGSVIGTHMATLYPHRVAGLHINMFASASTGSANFMLMLGSFWPSMLMPKDKAHLVYPLLPKYAHVLQESGYLHIQSTKPDTVGAALSDSPIGLAAYILEKFSTWTDKSKMDRNDGGLLGEGAKFNLTELLDNVMIYWVTNSITTSMRIYSETMNTRSFQTGMDSIVCTVATGVTNFPGDLFLVPRAVASFKFSNLLSFNFADRGGHFAAFEEPQLLVEELVNFIRMAESKH